MTHLEFLDDTVKFYSKNPKKRRSFTTVKPSKKEAREGAQPQVVCLYRRFSKRGNPVAACAIGRYLDKYKPKFDVGSGMSIYDIDEECFNEEIKKLCKRFLQRVQSLHDTCCYWTTEGLSEHGRIHYEQLKELAINLDKELSN